MKINNIIFVFLLAFQQNLNGQITVETLAGTDQLNYINYINKDLDSLAKWNYFNLNRFTFNYIDHTKNNVSIESQLTYQFIPGMGISIGGGYYGDVLIPSLGLSFGYLNKKEDFFIQLFPTMIYVEKQLAPSVLGLMNYSPKIDGNWGLNTQLIFSMDPVETSQLLRIGASFNEQFQFGLGVDIQKKWISRTVDFNFGPFLRYTF